MLRLWNTASRSLEEFVPIQKGKVGLYTCGPTVYWDAHIGNMRSYVFEDVLERTLELEGYTVTRVMNITDVGELTDAGEDKMLLGAKREGKTVQEVAQMYLDRFLKDASSLNIKIPPHPFLCKATDHIPEQIDLIKTLEEKGFAYTISDGVYFDTAKFPSYGSFSGQKLEDKAEGARVEINAEKRSKTDFALWKFAPANAERQLWESPWGVGFPGWHIECSAMARKYLGQPLDIHCGGIDHIPVHHENEIAQSEAAYGVKLTNFWLHNEFLNVDGHKMSKTLGNLYTVEDLKAKGFDPLAYRFYCLGTHYRSKLNFTWEGLEGAQNALRKLQMIARGLAVGAHGYAPVPAHAPIPAFVEALEDDLNTPKALAVMWEILGSSVSDEEKGSVLVMMDRVLGLGLKEIIGQPIRAPGDVVALAEERQLARENKDWKKSDELREAIESKGWAVEDTKDGFNLTPAT